MRNIMIGFLLIFLDFNLDLGNASLGLIPDWIGYLVMVKGLMEMSGESPFFGKIRPFASGMAVYTGILYLMDLFGISASLGALTYLLAIASTAVSLYISYCIVLGVKDMEDNYGILFNSDQLMSLWKVLAVINVVIYPMMLFPGLSILGILAGCIVTILFLSAFSKSKNLYEDMRQLRG